MNCEGLTKEHTEPWELKLGLPSNIRVPPFDLGSVDKEGSQIG